MEKHTKGPWGIAHNGWSHAPWVIYTGTAPRFNVKGFPTWPADDASWVIAEVTESEMPEHEANARLIAAAPELLAALEAAYEAHLLVGAAKAAASDKLYGPNGIVHLAIAKAKS